MESHLPVEQFPDPHIGGRGVRTRSGTLHKTGLPPSCKAQKCRRDPLDLDCLAVAESAGLSPPACRRHRSGCCRICWCRPPLPPPPAVPRCRASSCRASSAEACPLPLPCLRRVSAVSLPVPRILPLLQLLCRRPSPPIPCRCRICWFAAPLLPPPPPPRLLMWFLVEQVSFFLCALHSKPLFPFGRGALPWPLFPKDLG